MAGNKNDLNTAVDYGYDTAQTEMTATEEIRAEARTRRETIEAYRNAIKALSDNPPENWKERIQEEQKTLMQQAPKPVELSALDYIANFFSVIFTGSRTEKRKAQLLQRGEIETWEKTTGPALADYLSEQKEALERNFDKKAQEANPEYVPEKTRKEHSGVLNELDRYQDELRRKNLFDAELQKPLGDERNLDFAAEMVVMGAMIKTLNSPEDQKFVKDFHETYWDDLHSYVHDEKEKLLDNDAFRSFCASQPKSEAGNIRMVQEFLEGKQNCKTMCMQYHVFLGREMQRNAQQEALAADQPGAVLTEQKNGPEPVQPNAMNMQ